MATIGIDFGTCFCSASWINPNTGNPEAVRFRDCGSEKMPSVIALTAQGNAFVGSGPYMQLEELSANTAILPEERTEFLSNFFFSIKTHLCKDQIWRRPDKDYTDADLIAIILKKIKYEVVISCAVKEEIDHVVLTHPVQFEEWKKDILKHAAALAGFYKVELLPEPIAAAMYAIRTGIVPISCKGLLVYDFGAGTFDVTYVQMEKDGELHMPVLPRGDAHCGGDDIDRALYEDWNKYVKANYGREIVNGEEADIAFLYRCRRRKEQISRGFLMSDEISEFIPGLGNVKRNFSKDDFERLTKPIIDKTLVQVKAVVDEVKQKALPLTHAILIGGSSNLPQVQSAISELLGKNVSIVTTGNNDIAVAVGAMYSVATKIATPKKEDTPKKAEISEQKVTTAQQPKECFCIYCGAKILTSHKVCMHCGKPNDFEHNHDHTN